MGYKHLLFKASTYKNGPKHQLLESSNMMIRFDKKFMKCQFFIMALALILSSSLCYGQIRSAIVDIEKILIQSNAAHLGREHVKAAQANLENGYAVLAKELSHLPEQQKQKEMQEAARALNQQLEFEKAAVNQVITRMMMEEIRSFRIQNKLELVLPKQIILDADAGIDITNQIIKAMNAKKPVFGKLPVVQVKKQPTQPTAPAPAPKRKK